MLIPIPSYEEVESFLKALKPGQVWKIKGLNSLYLVWNLVYNDFNGTNVEHMRPGEFVMVIEANYEEVRLGDGKETTISFLYGEKLLRKVRLSPGGWFNRFELMESSNNDNDD